MYRIIAILAFLLATFPAFAQETEACEPVSDTVFVTFGDTLILRDLPSTEAEDLGNVVNDQNLGILVPLAFTLDASDEPWLLVSTQNTLGWVYSSSTIPYFQDAETANFEEKQAVNHEYNLYGDGTAAAVCVSQVEAMGMNSLVRLGNMPQAEAYEIEVNPDGWHIEIPNGWNIRSGAGTGFSVVRTTESQEQIVSVTRIHEIRVDSLDYEWFLFVEDGEIHFVGQPVTVEHDR